MHSLLPLSLCLALLQSTHGLIFPVDIRTSNEPRRFGRRADSNTLAVGNYGNAQYFANITIAGTEVAVMLDTGSSDLWVNFPDSAPSTTDTGKSLTLGYAIGSAGGHINTAEVKFYDFTIKSQAFLLVTDTSTFSGDIHASGYDGLLGLGPNEGSRILDEIDDASANTLLTNVFTQEKSSTNYITILLSRAGDPGQNFTAQMTISEIVSGFEEVTKMPKIDVQSVYKLLEEEQHWQGLTDKDNGIIGPDGEIIKYDSIVPKAPDGQLVCVFDSGFTFSQVPRDISDAIYGRVQNAEYDTKNEWWLVPCGQMLNISFNFGGQNYPVHPLDTADDNFNAKNAAGERMCIGSFQPITTAFSLLGNYDIILGMNFLRNAYTLINFGKWASEDSDTHDPYIQLLPLTEMKTAQSDFVDVRLGGTDTTADSQWTLKPASEKVSSPVSDEEKKKKYQEMILSRWPYIFVGCLIATLLIVGIIVWRCCCRRDKNGNRPGCCCRRKATMPIQKREKSSYLPMQDQSSVRDLNASSVSLNPPAAFGQQEQWRGSEYSGFGKQGNQQYIGESEHQQQSPFQDNQAYGYEGHTGGQAPGYENHSPAAYGHNPNGYESHSPSGYEGHVADGYGGHSPNQQQAYRGAY
ncbi:acid protease [Cylindrobasidium torrendii FP15055 ss-10]|uniref:Acid protease n=1 Tax=Cylindrobasidium torrendii FP15055 ss-10 TaxID=1314674 RepID=A0A0D7B311_9AGAR|nr:acid protease [Cylindrobasidium torrendii FP15055 ss-10]